MEFISFYFIWQTNILKSLPNTFWDNGQLLHEHDVIGRKSYNSIKLPPSACFIHYFYCAPSINYRIELLPLSMYALHNFPIANYSHTLSLIHLINKLFHAVGGKLKCFSIYFIHLWHQVSNCKRHRHKIEKTFQEKFIVKLKKGE